MFKGIIDIARNRDIQTSFSIYWNSFHVKCLCEEKQLRSVENNIIWFTQIKTNYFTGNRSQCLTVVNYNALLYSFRLYYSNWSLAHLRVATSASVLQCMFISIKHFFIVVNNARSNWLAKNWENTSSVALPILLKQQSFIQPYLNHKVHNPVKLVCCILYISHDTIQNISDYN